MAWMLAALKGRREKMGSLRLRSFLFSFALVPYTEMTGGRHQCVSLHIQRKRSGWRK